MWWCMNAFSAARRTNWALRSVMRGDERVLASRACAQRPTTSAGFAGVDRCLYSSYRKSACLVAEPKHQPSPTSPAGRQWPTRLSSTTYKMTSYLSNHHKTGYQVRSRILLFRAGEVFRDAIDAECLLRHSNARNEPTRRRGDSQAGAKCERLSRIGCSHKAPPTTSKAHQHTLTSSFADPGYMVPRTIAAKGLHDAWTTKRV